jgi:hypothetical protein
MPSRSAGKLKVSYIPIAIGAVVLLLLAAAAIYLSHSQKESQPEAVASAEAKAYVKNLDLSNVHMQAAENFMQQRVVEIDGNISNKGSRALNRVDVYCLFYSPSGQLVHRERVSIVRGKGTPFYPGETKPFRLPFDTLPENWNQAMPNLVVAGIEFSR